MLFRSLTSKNCFALEHLTGFHSGWKAGDDGEDYSLLPRINYKTLITPEGDVIMSSPHFVEIMSQQRRIFDGTSGAIYKNTKEDRRYTGLRTPWIIAGTPALMDTDQSRLGDRFLREWIPQPNAEERAEILRRVGYTALRSVLRTSDGDARGYIDDRLALAYQLTGGYVDYLRASAEDLLSSLVINEEDNIERCATLGEFTADMRARPDRDKTKEHDATKELPSRLTHQYVRLACCLAVVKQRPEVDAEVMRVVQRVALDTSRGKTMAIAGHLYTAGLDGMETVQLAALTASTDDRVRTLLRFMQQIDVVVSFRQKTGGLGSKVKYRLTRRMASLYRAVMGSDRADHT